MAHPKREKILVVQTSFLGDVVLTTPVFSAIKRIFPDCDLSVLCTPQARSLLEANPFVDEIIPDDKRASARGIIGLWRQAQELRGLGFTRALSPHKSLRTAVLLFLARIPCRIGFRQSAGWFLYHRRVHRDATLHDVDRNLSILEGLGVDAGSCPRDLCVGVASDRRESVKRLFQSLGIQRNGLVFGLNPGSVWATKRWSIQGYAELMGHLKRRYRCGILLFGGPEDSEIVGRIQKLSGNLGVSLVGMLSLEELPCAIEWCDVFVTNDSGPMHIAAARGVPVVGIFCATTPALGFYPYSSRAVVVEKDLPCRPCSSHGGRRCPLGTEDCIRLIGAEDVLRAVERLLDGKDGIASDGSKPQLPRFMTL